MSSFFIIPGISMLLLMVALLTRRFVRSDKNFMGAQSPFNCAGVYLCVEHNSRANGYRRRLVQTLAAGVSLVLLGASRAFARPPEGATGEANLKVPDLSQVQ